MVGSSGESRGVGGSVMDKYSNMLKELRKRGVECAQCGDSYLRGRLLWFKCEWALNLPDGFSRAEHGYRVPDYPSGPEPNQLYWFSTRRVIGYNRVQPD
ncbi:hypothetical protein PIB30_038519 [Stylosanthes scabra]|uniref:Uncharacterized protein n=1 Tax=Stylosanthes scabra TaxID=79078 RepID=A0ABU6UCN6_9FABA|nr:hypothetical protein [Stylosanthes scabra]